MIKDHIISFTCNMKGEERPSNFKLFEIVHHRRCHEERIITFQRQIGSALSIQLRTARTGVILFVNSTLTRKQLTPG